MLTVTRSVCCVSLFLKYMLLFYFPTALDLLIHCLLHLPLFVGCLGVCVWSLFCYTVLRGLSSFSEREGERDDCCFKYCRVAMGLPVVYDCGMPWSYALAFYALFPRGGGGYTHLFFIRRLGPSIYCLPPKISGI